MDKVPALKSAFDLIHFPSQVRQVREAPLPSDVGMLLRVAAGDEEAINLALRMSGRSLQAVREAAGFYIEQILLFPEADSYRVLGADKGASSDELRRNMAMLLRWLHPDMQDSRAIFANRVTRAWNDLKTAEKRAAYDRTLVKTKRASPSQNGARHKKPGERSNRHSARGGPHKDARHGASRGKRQQAGLLDRILFLLLGKLVH